VTKCPHCGWDSKELTQREAQVEKFLINRPDLCMKEIATELNITNKTVEVHKTAIFRKRGVRSRVELLHQAVVMGRFVVNDVAEHAEMV
jgi:DNA-binding NarL/FixJ family response regulator